MKRTIWLAVAAFALAQGAIAQEYPQRAVRLIAPNQPGSSSDVIGRIITSRWPEVLGQQIVVENQAGAGGMIGMDALKNAAPDGYTIGIATPSAMTIAPNLRKKITYDPLKDFEFVSMFAVQPNLLVTRVGGPFKTVKELIDYARKNPGKLNMATAGPGSQSHLAGVLLQVMADFQCLHVPYKGGGASVLSVVTGESDWTLTPGTAAIGQVRNGKLIAVAHSLPSRTPLLEGVPAIAETVPGFSYSGWNGIVVPRGTPKPVIEKLRATLEKTLAIPEVKSALAKQTAVAGTSTSEEFRSLVQNEIKSMAKVVSAAKLKVE
jgi:tripartite-type tricarboxylate transporter receptor subunit TctC